MAPRKARSSRKTAKKGKTARAAIADRSRLVGRVLIIASLVACGGWGLTRLEHSVLDQISQSAAPTIVFTDMPHAVMEHARPAMEAAVADLTERTWTEDNLCREIADRVAEVAWIARVRHVRRRENGRIEVSCRYRTPYGMTCDGTVYYLVGRDGVRLPGVYDEDPSWPHVLGVRGPAPEPGKPWNDESLKAGLNVISLLANEPYRQQVTAVLVDNHRGRLDPRRAHIELATNVMGGRVYWGSEPGLEIEENSVEQKIAILRTNYRQTGRIDAGHTAIDISTFPDRFSIPGQGS